MQDGGAQRPHRAGVHTWWPVAGSPGRAAALELTALRSVALALNWCASGLVRPPQEKAGSVPCVLKSQPREEEAARRLRAWLVWASAPGPAGKAWTGTRESGPLRPVAGEQPRPAQPSLDSVSSATVAPPTPTCEWEASQWPAPQPSLALALLPQPCWPLGTASLQPVGHRVLPWLFPALPVASPALTPTSPESLACS